MSPTKKPATIVQQHPAETSTPVAMAVAALICRALHTSAETVAYVAIVVAFVPAAITWGVTLIRG